jgi:hypothetical protein
VLNTLLIVVVAAHLAAAGLAGAGPFVYVWLQWRERRSADAPAGAIGQALARNCVRSATLAIALGAAALGLVWLSQSDDYFSAAGRIPAHRYVFGGVELLFYFGCLGIHLAAWRRGMAAGSWYQIVGWWLLPLAAATNLAYHFPALFAVIAVASSRQGALGGEIDFSAMLTDVEVVSRAVHHSVASLVVAGLALSLCAWRLQRENDGQAPMAAAAGARLALAAAIAQLASGAWVLASVPREARLSLLGASPAAAVLFGAGVLAAVALIQRLLAASLGNHEKRQAVVCAVLAAVVFLLMTAARHLARLDGHADADAAPRLGTYCDSAGCESIANSRSMLTAASTIISPPPGATSEFTVS